MIVRKKVLLLGEYGTLNGGENSFLAIAPELAQLGCTFSAAIPIHSEFQSRLEESGFDCHALELFGNDGRRKSVEAIQDHVRELATRIAPDIVHCNSLSTSRIYGAISSQLGIPSIGYLRDIIRISAKATHDISELDRIIAVSNATKKWHTERGIPEQKVRVIYNGVDSGSFSPELATSHELEIELQRSSITNEASLLLSVGQIGMRKGLDVLLQSFRQVLRVFPDSHLLIVGQRHSQKTEALEYEEQLRQTADEINQSYQSNSVIWLGRRTDIPDLMRRANVLVHTARQEPLGRVLLEAASSGLPIVSTSAGGTNEIIDHNWIAPIDDSTAISNLIVKLLADPALQTSVSNNLRRIALSKFSTHNCAERLNEEYNSLLE